MGKSMMTLAVACLLMGGATQLRAEETDARALVAQTLEALPQNSLEAKMTVSSKDFQPRELRMVRKYVHGANGTYLEVLAPDDLEGIRFLFLERANQPNEQYIKVKASRSAIQVSEEVRRQPFLGSTFYVSDLVMPNIDDYTYKYVGKDVVGERTVTLVEMTPKSKEDQLYGKTVVAIDPTEHLVLRREFFNEDGKKVKVWTVDKLEKISGIWSLTGQKMQNLEDGIESRIDVSEVKFDTKVDDAIFTPRYLLR